MQVSEKSEELYDELAKQIEANDDAAARGIFQELLNNGFSRQEIVVRVSRLIEISPRISISGAAGSGSALLDILHPFFEIAAVRGEVEADTEAGAAESDIYAGLTQDRRLTNSCASVEARPRRPDESRDFRRDPGKDDYCAAAASGCTATASRLALRNVPMWRSASWIRSGLAFHGSETHLRVQREMGALDRDRIGVSRIFKFPPF